MTLFSFQASEIALQYHILASQATVKDYDK